MGRKSRSKSKKPAPDDGGKIRDNKFEDIVCTLLQKLAGEHPKRVYVRSHPHLVLHNRQTVIPDFELKYELPFQTDYRLIECQDRLRSSQDILHKIRSVRSISERNRFIFLYRAKDSISDALRKSLEADGVVHYDIYEFAAFLESLGDTFEKLDTPTRERTLVPKRYVNAALLWAHLQDIDRLRLRQLFTGDLAEDPAKLEEISEQLEESRRARQVEEMLRRESWRKGDAAMLSRR